MADQIDPRDQGARARQSPRQETQAAPRVQDTPTDDRLEPLEEELVGVLASEDGVLFPVGSGSFSLDARPGFADLTGVDTGHSARQIEAHGKWGVTRTGRGFRQLMGIGVLVLAAVLSGCSPRPQPAPEQPIAYNHSVHVQDEEMECTRCHLGAETQNRAGLPPMTVCAGCHRRQGADIPAVQAFMELYDGGQGEPLAWNKVNVIPESAMVHFKHKPHARAGVGCESCHGDIGSMTVAQQVLNVANMGWCVDCHRERGASTDCLTCHH
jgi:predicted CXXCH cytochrome family protein